MEEKMHIEFLVGGDAPELSAFKEGEVREVQARIGETFVMRGMAKVALKAPEPEASKPAPKPQVKKDKKVKAKEGQANG